LEKELAYNVRGASKLIEEETDDIWAILEEEVKGKLVLLNRAPTLHRLGIQAFQPVLIEGESIQLHPMVCKAFNADFDGDQMAVHLPLSVVAQKEARKLMLSSKNLLKPATGTPISSLNQDISLGCYWLTKIKEDGELLDKFFGSPEEAILTNDLGQVNIREKIKVRGIKGAKPDEFIETSVGRIIFNETLPDDFPFQNILIKAKELEKITSKLIFKYGLDATEEALDKIKNLGFEYATRSGISLGIDDLVIPPQKGEIIKEAEKATSQIEDHYKKGLLAKEEKTAKVIEVWIKAKSEIEKLVPKFLPADGSVFQIVDSGSRGSWNQPVQMAGMKGLVINPAGQIIELPVKNSFKEGFNVLEYFISTHGARKGTADTALRTSTAGYLTRRLVDVAHEVIVSESDCGTIKGIELIKQEAEKIGQSFLSKIIGRIVLEDVKAEVDGKKKTILKAGEIIDLEKGEEIITLGVEKVYVRSPLTCNSVRGVCQKCYGWDLGHNELVKMGEAVGVVAAQAIGEPGTQLTMRTFHTGGVAGGGDITFGLPRVQEIFEARIPGGKATISQVDGIVSEITQDRIVRIKIKDEKGKTKPKKTEDGKDVSIAEYQVPPKCGILVGPTQEVHKGDPLCEGSLDLKELFKATGVFRTQNYIVNEVQRIYVSQGAQIHDKHIETIVRQMFSRIKVKDVGDSFLIPGEVLERTGFLEINAGLKKEGKNPAKGVPVLLGISRVALTTNSWLSSASFQETSRVLIKSSLEGKEDKLKGLKENVIIGKLIPAGTGFRKEK
jgi:DNA-directed RNA polymerase subunit beta'